MNKSIERPSRVSAEVWLEIKEDDRKDTLLLAGRMTLRGASPDDAIMMAVVKLRHDRLLERKGGKQALRVLSRAYRERMGDVQPRSPMLTAALQACLDVSDLAADRIQAGDDALKVAVAEGLWHVTCDELNLARCAACGDEVEQDERAKGSLTVHQSCLESMRVIGTAFRDAVQQVLIIPSD